MTCVVWALCALSLSFFFQAEDGIRDLTVTGVQTCALPISKQIPVIMLTGRTEEFDKVTGLEAGADDYLTKPFSHRELLARIKAVVRRRAPLLGDEPVEFGDLKLDPAAHRVSSGSGKINLWATEFRLLHFLMTHPDRVYSRGQLLDEVWGDHVFVEDRTVDVHIRRLRQALQAGGLHKISQKRRGAGYWFRANPACARSGWHRFPCSVRNAA